MASWTTGSRPPSPGTARNPDLGHREVDTATCERLRDAIEPHLGPQQTIILDLSGVEFMDSSSLNVLVQARGTLTADGGSLFLRNPSVAAHRLVTINGLEDLLQTDADTHRD